MDDPTPARGVRPTHRRKHVKLFQRRWALAAVSAAAVVSLVASCSSSPSTSASSSPSSSSAAAPAGSSSAAAPAESASAAPAGSTSAGSSSATNPNAGKDLTVGVIYLDTQGFYGGVKAGIVAGAASAGQKVKIIETNAQDDATKEATFMGTLTAQKVQAILTSASSGTASVPAIKAATAAGIPVICYNTCIAEPDVSKYVSAYAVGDPVEFGTKLGTAAAAYFKSKNISAPKIGVLNCEFVEVCVKRREGFEAGLKAAGINYTIADNQQGTDPVKSITVAQNMLTAHPDIDAFMGESGGATTGAIKAVSDAGRVGKTVVFGGDMTTEIATALKDNTILKAEVDVSGKAVGQAAIKAAIDTINGKKPAGITVPVPVDIYTSPADASKWLTTHPDGIP